MQILVKCILLYLFSSQAFAGVAQCVKDYNKAVEERNKAKGSYQSALNYKRRAESFQEKKDNKKLYNTSLDWVKMAISNLSQAEKDIGKVKTGGCPDSLIENAGSLSQKNIIDGATYDTMRVNLLRILSMLN